MGRTGGERLNRTIEQLEARLEIVPIGREAGDGAWPADVYAVEPL